jgi:hypothetical protein
MFYSTDDDEWDTTIDAIFFSFVSQITPAWTIQYRHPAYFTTLPKYSATRVRPSANPRPPAPRLQVLGPKESLLQHIRDKLEKWGSHVRAIRAIVVLKDYEGNQRLILEAVVNVVPEMMILQFLWYLVNMSLRM